MPPSSCASIWPPNRSPLTPTASESIEMIGNLPCASSEGWMRRPWMAPENSRFPRPLIPVTHAENRRDLEAVAGRRADAEEDAEAGLRLERPVAEEREVVGLARDVERADL